MTTMFLACAICGVSCFALLVGVVVGWMAGHSRADRTIDAAHQGVIDNLASMGIQPCEICGDAAQELKIRVNQEEKAVVYLCAECLAEDMSIDDVE